MSLLVNLTQAIVDDNKNELDGKVLTRAALRVTDGRERIYAIDVDIGDADRVLRNVPLARQPGSAVCRTWQSRFACAT